jgi:pre-rRNA-processing protein TSR1
MRSFRTSPWDAYENLPRDYARIFQFEDFKRTERGVRRRAAQELAIVEVSVSVPRPHSTILIYPSFSLVFELLFI